MTVEIHIELVHNAGGVWATQDVTHLSTRERVDILRKWAAEAKPNNMHARLVRITRETIV